MSETRYEVNSSLVIMYANDLVLHIQWYPEIQHFCPNVPMVLVGVQVYLLHLALWLN